MSAVLFASRAALRASSSAAASAASAPASSAAAAAAAAGGVGGVRAVREQGADAVLGEIECALLKVARSVLAGEGFAYDVPTRSAANSVYIDELNRIVMQSRTTSRSFTTVAQTRKAAIMTRVMQLLFDVLRKGIHVTKRDLFYTDVKLFRDQKESDTILEDAAAMLGCTRTSLHVVASDKGIVVGRLQFRDDGDLIDWWVAGRVPPTPTPTSAAAFTAAAPELCGALLTARASSPPLSCSMRMGIGGKAIPPFMDRISDIRSDANFILLVEKEAAFMRIAE